MIAAKDNAKSNWSSVPRKFQAVDIVTEFDIGLDDCRSTSVTNKHTITPGGTRLARAAPRQNPVLYLGL